MMLWRVVGDIVFSTVVRRTQFLNVLNNWLATHTMVVENVRVMDFDDFDPEEGGSPVPISPTVRFSVAAETDVDNLLLFQTIGTGSVVGVIHALVSRHRCRLHAGDPPSGDSTPVYFEYP